MLRFVYATFFGVIVAIMQIIITKAMLKLDNEVDEQCTNLDMVVMLISAILAECWIAMLTPMDAQHVNVWIQSQLFITLFEIQSCIDNKIKQVYDLLTYVVIAYQAINLLVCNFKELGAGGSPLIQAERIIPVVVILQLIAIITAFNGIGKGDTFIYVALGIHYITYADIPWFTMTIGLFISCALFTLSNTVDGLRHKKMQEHKPFTMFIQIASVFTFA